MVKKCIYGDASEPGVERRIRSKTAYRLIGFQPDFLGKVFGVLRVAAIVKCQQIDPSRVAFGYFAERIGVSRLRTTNQVSFGVVFSFAIGQALNLGDTK